MSGTAVGIAAALAFAAMYFLLNVGFLPALVLSGGLYVGLAVFSVVRDRAARETTGTERGAVGGGGKRASRPPLNVDLSGLSITQEEFESALREGSKKLATLKRAAERISDRGVRGKAYAVCDAVARILSDIRDDPKDLKPARKFLGYYLDATIKVVDRYAALATKSVSSDELSESLERAEASLDTIKNAYDKQLAQLLENDVMDLDTELRVLEQTIRMEGLGD